MKKILIIDEYGFSKICEAILGSSGYAVEIFSMVNDNINSKLNQYDFDLVVTSYPYGAVFFNEIKKKNIPVLVLADNIDQTLLKWLNDFNSSYCMIKPLDYHKFKTVIQKVIDGDININGYSIL
ncbi:MAG: hypothetical protein N2257_04170 [Thermodesulfovibrionales bacterium]|nr:hypothetical protein [Thermodesulfovibrionales bacterium]